MSDILVHTESGVTTLTLNRPERKNSITAAMYDALDRALVAAQADDAVRVVVIQGHETVFAQIVADKLGIPEASVEIVHGDTSKIPFGMRSYVSRS